jgi:DNA-binding LytR/AlgR family response regulator
VLWIKAEGDYARIHTGSDSYLVHRTLNELEARLDPADFLRVHRSAIVRLDQIAEVLLADSGRFQLTLSTGLRLVVSRSRGAALRKLMLQRIASVAEMELSQWITRRRTLTPTYPGRSAF